MKVVRPIIISNGVPLLLKEFGTIAGTEKEGKNGGTRPIIIVKDPRVSRPYLFSDGQNIYNRVVLVCRVNVYIPASLGRRPVLRQTRYVKNCTHFTYSLRTDSYGSCRECCKQFEINTARHLLSAVFIARHFKYRKQKTQPNLQSETLFLSIIFRRFLINFVSYQTNRRCQTSIKVSVVPGT